MNKRYFVKRLAVSFEIWDREHNHMVYRAGAYDLLTYGLPPQRQPMPEPTGLWARLSARIAAAIMQGV